MTNDAIDPTRSALLLLDMEPALLAGLGCDPAPLLDRTEQAITRAREARLQVAYVHVAFAAQDIASIPEHNKLFWAGAQNSMLPPAGSELSDPHERLRPHEGDVVVTKTRFGSFGTTALDTHLRGRGVDTLIIGGISSGGAVLSTVRDAADRDYRLYVAEDLCADPDPDLHRVLFDHVFPVQAEIVDSARMAITRQE